MIENTGRETGLSGFSCWVKLWLLIRTLLLCYLHHEKNKKHLDCLLHSEALGQGWIKRIEEGFFLFLVKCSVKYSSFSIWANKRSYISFYKVQHLLTEFQLFFLMSNCLWIILLCPGLMSNVTSYIQLFHYIKSKINFFLISSTDTESLILIASFQVYT